MVITQLKDKDTRYGSCLCCCLVLLSYGGVRGVFFWCQFPVGHRLLVLFTAKA